MFRTNQKYPHNLQVKITYNKNEENVTKNLRQERIQPNRQRRQFDLTLFRRLKRAKANKTKN